MTVTDPLLNELVPDPGPAPQTKQDVSDAEREKNKGVIRLWMDGAWNKSRFDLADTVFAEDMWFWDPFSPVVTCCEEFKQWARGIDVAFPDRSLSIDHVIAKGDKIAYRVTLRGVHGGDFLGYPATGRKINASAQVMSIHENGRYKKAWQIFDVYRVLRQIGVA